jgi:hypothetical protein
MAILKKNGSLDSGIQALPKTHVTWPTRENFSTDAAYIKHSLSLCCAVDSNNFRGSKLSIDIMIVFYSRQWYIKISTVHPTILR